MRVSFRATRLTVRRLAAVVDFGTQERWQHADRVLQEDGGMGACVARVAVEHPLDILVEKQVITGDMRSAAFRFKRDFQAGRLEAFMVASYGARAGQGSSPQAFGLERTDAEEAAYMRWRLAMRAMGAPYNNVIVTAVCHDKVPPQAIWSFIKVGLERLAKWYGMAEVPKGAVGMAVARRTQ